MNRYEDYVRQQFKKLDNTIYGFGIVISDGNGNRTNRMELTPQKAELIIKILKEIKEK
jgi:hypothetical protein|tara:strand:- start:67 stop:240 length:174 start_codon:yes stop_codon:yes gene_type:complete